jgi:hypothetical protein
VSGGKGVAGGWAGGDGGRAWVGHGGSPRLGVCLGRWPRAVVRQGRCAGCGGSNAGTRCVNIWLGHSNAPVFATAQHTGDSW